MLIRFGLNTEVYVMNVLEENVLRLPNASYYVSTGKYDLFVL